MQTLAAQDVWIACAILSNTLTVTEHVSQFGGTYIAIGDEHGLIEIQATRKEADARVADVRKRARVAVACAVRSGAGVRFDQESD